MTKSRKFFFLIFFCVAGLLLVSNANAQTGMLDSLTGSGQETDADALNSLIEGARAEGSTVIVITPGGEETSTNSSTAMPMNSEMLLKSRGNVRRMVTEAPLIPTRITEALDEASYDGTPYWLFWAVGTAILGVLLGLGVYRLVSGWLREQARKLYRTKNLNRADKLSFLMLRGTLLLISSGVMFAVAIVVAVILDFEHEPARMTIFTIVATYASYRVLRYVIFLNFFAPDLSAHRMIALDDDRARRLYNDWIYFLLISAYILGGVAWLRGLELNNDSFRLISIAGLGIASAMAIWLTVRHRKDVIDIVRGKGENGPPGQWRNFAAHAVSPLLVIYIVVASVVSSFRLSLGLPGGYTIIIAPIIVFIAGALVYAIAIVVLDRIYEWRARKFRRMQIINYRRARAQANRRSAAERLAEETDEAMMEMVGDGEEMIIHHPDANPEDVLKQQYNPLFKGLIENAIVTVILIFAIGELARLWGLNFDQEGGHPLVNALDSVLIGVYTFLAYQAVNLYIDKKIIEEGGSLDDTPVNPGEGDSEGGVGESRMATLLPIFRNVFISVLVIVSGAFILSNWGVNVAPLFAGAGVVGLAIGFGAQTLIRDIFSGVFFLVDDAFRKGEYIEVGTVKGVIEKISMRSFQLRHHLGAVHTIPFGEIQQLTNYSRDWVMMKLPLRLTYGTDVEKVRKLVKKLGQELLVHEQIGHLFLQPLKSQGVYAMEDSAMIVRVKFMTRPGDQFVTRKVVYQAIRDLFEKEGINFAHREVTVRLADEVPASSLTPQQKEAITGSVRSLIDEEEARARQGSESGSR